VFTACEGNIGEIIWSLLEYMHVPEKLKHFSRRLSKKNIYQPVFLQCAVWKKYGGIDPQIDRWKEAIDYYKYKPCHL
jgi:GH15 family glucan-1,4-alpha-glucosidase